MSDLRTDLDRARRLAPVPRLDLERIRRRRDRRERTRRAGTIALALGVSAAVLGAVVGALRPSGPGVRVGRGAEAPPTVDLAVPPGSYAYVRTVSYAAGDGRWEETLTLEVWYSPSDASGRMRAEGPYGLPGPHGDSDDVRYGPGELEVEDSETLPTDPSALAEALVARSAPGGASPVIQPTPEVGDQAADTPQLVRAIGDLLGYPDTPPGLKAALFQVLADLPGMEVERGSIDPMGRSASRLSIRTEGTFRTWWFDASSGQVLSWMARDVEDGELLAVTVVERAGIVGSTDASALEERFVPDADGPPPSGLHG